MPLPALHPSAAIALAPGVTVQTGCLRDAAGREYPVDPYGELVAQSCRQLVTLRDLTRAMAFLSGDTPASVESALRSYLITLEARRLVSVQQSFVRELVRDLSLWSFDVIVMAATRSLPPARFVSRRIYPPTVRNLARAVAESFSYLIAAAILIAVSVIVMTDLAIPLTAALTLDRSAVLELVVTSVTLLVLLAAFVHELGHMLAARWLGVPAIGVQARRGVASVLFAPGSEGRMRAVILAGPLSGALFAGLVGVLMLDLLTPGWEVATVDNVRLSIGCVALLVAACQLLSLLPLFGDGKARRASRRVEP